MCEDGCMHWQGELLHINVAPHASAPIQALSEARLLAGIGIEGDRYATRLGTYSRKHHIDRQATLIEVEALEALTRDHHIERQKGAPTRAIQAVAAKTLWTPIGHQRRAGELNNTIKR